MPRKRENLVDEFVKLVQEITDYRASQIENIAGLIEAKAWKSLKSYCENPMLAQFLTSGEQDFLRVIIAKHLNEQDFLN